MIFVPRNHILIILQRKAKIPATWRTACKEDTIKTGRSSDSVKLDELVLDRVQWWVVILVLLNLAELKVKFQSH